MRLLSSLALGAIVVSSLCVPSLALAIEAPGTSPFRAFPGLELGLRLGLAHPGGQVGAGSAATTPNVGDVATTWVPFGLDAGARISPRVYVGASIDWGPTVEQGHGACFSCDTGSDFQARAEVRWFALPRSIWSPWLSLGAGWEVLHAAFGYGSTTSSATYDGPILGDIKLGLDVRSRAISVGPYFGVTLAEFTSRSLDPSPSGATSGVGALALHEWFVLGVRGTYGPH